jgi:hypothetical protein
MGITVVRRARRTTTKSKGSKTRATMRKKTVNRAAAKRTKKSTKKRPKKTRRSAPSKRVQARQQHRGATPVLEETVVDIIDEPLPGAVRVTEIEETEVRVPDSDQGEE